MVFSEIKKLIKNLDLSDNLLRMIEQGAFEGLDELIYLSLRNNRLTSNSLHEKIFEDLISLQDLAINYNYFHDEYTFLQSELSRVRSLVKLGIDLRGRHQIDKCLCNLSKLQELQIYAEPAQKYSENSFQNLKCLQIDTLFLHSVMSLTPNALISFPHLKTLRLCIVELDATDNVISSIFNSLKSFRGRNMTEISITGNPLRNGPERKKTIPNVVFYSFCIPKTLEKLDLHSPVKAYTKRRIANITMYNGSNLKFLNLANITFGDCDGTIFGIENLEYFDMSGFICKVLSVHLLSHFPNLITLIAQDANLGIGLNTLTDASEFLKMNLDLQHIDLMKNSINSLPDGLFNHPFRQKFSIILDRNNLQSLPNFPSKPNTVQVISLKYNRFSCFSDENIAKLNIIKPSSVFLRGNPIECSFERLQPLFVSQGFQRWNAYCRLHVEAINSSRKVVFVITENFLDSSWGTYEIEMTRMHAFREGRESMVIVILKDDIKKDKLPKALKEIWYKVVCIVWPTDPDASYNSEESFYEKLCITLSDGRKRINDDSIPMK
ncbi:unnamed protein product [Mytilus coruscus]|uniref:TIR domain-containing protein n=1 Tax=Mytilus coruscus TaxID=42192 RepID=A0A6J8CV96_MYTCO|nr:unnamed protein product [Mytilus coruscus]